MCGPFLDELASISSQIGIIGVVENRYFDAVMIVIYVWVDVSTEFRCGDAVDPEVAVTIIVLSAIVELKVALDGAKYGRQGRADNGIGAEVFRVGSGAAIFMLGQCSVTLAHSFLNAAVHISCNAGNDG